MDKEDLSAYLDPIRDEFSKLASKKVDKTTQNLVLKAAKDHLFHFELEKSLKQVFATKIPVVKYAGKKNVKVKRALNILLSDTHYGSSLDPEETGKSYGVVEEARRTAEICRQAADYKRDHRSETELVVHLLGDLIHGRLHDLGEGEPLARQVAITIHILTQALTFLSGEFQKVTVYCATGNHGRNKARHMDRAVSQKWDSMETIIYYALKTAFANNPNIKINIPKTPYYSFSLFPGQNGFATHGDTVLKPGNPGKNINVASIRNQINEINSAQIGKKKAPYNLFMVGHVHTASLSHLANGAIFLSNSALIPPDAYANHIGIFETNCGQWIWESVPGHIFGDSRFIHVNEETDKDGSLDQIIQPFKGF